MNMRTFFGKPSAIKAAVRSPSLNCWSPAPCSVCRRCAAAGGESVARRPAASIARIVYARWGLPCTATMTYMAICRRAGDQTRRRRCSEFGSVCAIAAV